MEENNLSTNENYKIQVACKQVSAILECYDEDLLNKMIPQKVLENLKNNSAKDFDYAVDPYNFDSSTLTDDALELLFVLFYEYFATDKQKQKINSYFNPINYNTFNPNEIFKPKEEIIENTQETNQLVVYSEPSLFKKILLKIKKFFAG